MQTKFHRKSSVVTPLPEPTAKEWEVLLKEAQAIGSLHVESIKPVSCQVRDTPILTKDDIEYLRAPIGNDHTERAKIIRSHVAAVQLKDCEQHALDMLYPLFSRMDDDATDEAPEADCSDSLVSDEDDETMTSLDKNGGSSDESIEENVKQSYARGTDKTFKSSIFCQEVQEVDVSSIADIIRHLYLDITICANDIDDVLHESWSGM